MPCELAMAKRHRESHLRSFIDMNAGFLLEKRRKVNVSELFFPSQLPHQLAGIPMLSITN